MLAPTNILRFVFVLWAFCMALPLAAQQQPVLFEISLPITGKSSHAIGRALERTALEFNKPIKTPQKPAKNGESENGKEPSEPTPSTVILKFNVGATQEEFGRGSSFGACYELASLISGEKFNGIRTVAFFPQSVKGHAILVALACDEIIAAKDAEIGEAAIDEASVSPTQRQAYHEISQRRRKIPLGLVDKLLDSNVELLQVETEKGTRLGTPAQIEELRKSETFAADPQVVIPAGQPGLFTAEAARKLNFVDLLADDKVALARGLGFRPDVIRNMPVPGEAGHAIRITVDGLMTMDKAGVAIRSIQAALNPATVAAQHQVVGDKKIDFICLEINSQGGNLSASLRLAAFLAKEIDTSKVRTVAYIPQQARADAALIATACDEIVLGPNAQLGGDGAVVFTSEAVAEEKSTIVDFLAKESVRSWSLPLGFVDSNLEVYKMTRQGQPPVVDYFCDEERKQQPDADLWKKGPLVKPQGELFRIIGGKGEQYLVDRSAKDFAEFKLLYGLDDDPLLIEPTWTDKLVQLLSSPGMQGFLLLLIFVCFIFEAQFPSGIGAFLAVICLVLFFWLSVLGGTAGWLEVTLFLFGVGCLLLEFFVLPGFGIFGVGGVLAIIASMVLASQTFIIPQNSYQLEQLQRSVFVLVTTIASLTAVLVILVRVFHDKNKPKDTAFIQETEKLACYDHLQGRTGITTTPLVPAGKCMFDDELVNVVSDGELIETGETVEVLDVVGYRVVVRHIR